MSTQPLPSNPREMTGLVLASFRYMMTSVLAALAQDPRGEPDDHAAQREAAAALLGDLHPTSPAQHMLAARTAAAHFAAMGCFRCAARPDITEAEGIRMLRAARDMSDLSTRTMQQLEQRHRAAEPTPATKRKIGGKNPMLSEKPATPPAETATPAATAASAAPPAKTAAPAEAAAPPAETAAPSAPPAEAAAPAARRTVSAGTAKPPAELSTDAPNWNALNWNAQSWDAYIKSLSTAELMEITDKMAAFLTETAQTYTPNAA